MTRIVKVFADEAEQDEVAKRAHVLERYDGFVVVEASDSEAKRLARDQLVEDITDLYAIPMTGGAIDTALPRVDTKGVTRSHPAYRRGARLPEGPHHYLVQFAGPIKDEWLKGVKKAGGEPRELHSNFVYVVRADEAAVEAIAALPYVRWVGHLPHEERLAEPVLAAIGGDPVTTLPRTQLLPDVYTVEFFGSKDVERAVPAVKKLGLKILIEEPQASFLVVEVTGTANERRKKLKELAAVHGVRKVRHRALSRPSNEVAAGIMGTTVTLGNPGLGLSGQGEVVAVCDTGIDSGNPAAIHTDFSGRVAAVKSYPMTAEFARHVKNPGADDGSADLGSGHGTHVAGSVLGDGVSSAGIAGLPGPIRGLAHKAELVFQAVEQALDWKDPRNLQRYGRYLLAGIPPDLKDLFSDAYRSGARIHSNSWGGGDPGAYDEQCEALDRYVWEHKDFCVLVAAGNDGTDNDGDGRINPTSVTSPGTAKNCITIGASENRRPGFVGETYGGESWWPDDYPVAPFKADPLANDPNHVVAFSSRGPTSDNRIKPEAVAPGTFILSTRSTMIAQNNTAWAPFPSTRLYFYMGGTSMATPLAAGAVALIREYLRKKKKIAAPSAALLKAALIAGAKRLSGYGTSGAVVDNHQGYGRVNLDAVLAPPAPSSTRFFEVRPGLRTGQVSRRKLKVKSGGKPLRIALAYSDFPGPSLVNNLNLIVTAPNGRKLVGNQRRGGPAKLDAANNAELVHVARADAGNWSVEIVGSNVPSGPQEFALVAIGHL